MSISNDRSLSSPKPTLLFISPVFGKTNCIVSIHGTPVTKLTTTAKTVLCCWLAVNSSFVLYTCRKVKYQWSDKTGYFLTHIKWLTHINSIYKHNIFENLYKRLCCFMYWFLCGLSL